MAQTEVQGRGGTQEAEGEAGQAQSTPTAAITIVCCFLNYFSLIICLFLQIMRADEEKRMAQRKKEEEERRQREVEEKKQRDIEEKRRRLEEAEKKRQAMMSALKEQSKSKGPNFTINKKEGVSVNPRIV